MKPLGVSPSKGNQGTTRGKEKTRTTMWNLPGPSGTWDCINIVSLSHPSPSPVEANTDVIHITLLIEQTCMFTESL